MTPKAKKAGQSCLAKAAFAWALLLLVGLVFVYRRILDIPLNPVNSGGFAREGEGRASSSGAGGHEVVPRAEEPHQRRVSEVASAPLPNLQASMAAVLPAATPSPLPPVALAANPAPARGAFPDDNAPRPPPRAGETDMKSPQPDILPGVDPDHLHGLLGRLSDGSPRIKPTPLPSNGLAQEERRDAHRGFCFNSWKSDSLPLDRDQSDVRSHGCQRKHDTYPKEGSLPAASVVIVFHNEALSILLRSVHSVLNHSPPRLLKEIILVDDASVAVSDRFYEKHWKRLQDELTDYCMQLPKVTLVRLKERRGLMVARMEGVWRATAEDVIFLDSHIEATQGWIEPLLARMKEDPSVVVVPSIDSIGNEDFSYHPGGGLGVLGFSWTLGQQPTWADTGPDGTRPAQSPVMAGGLFGSNRRWFLRLGGYDLEMRLYGGEEMEIGFRTWMCGGKIEFIPCSHVGHVFRSCSHVGRRSRLSYKVPGEEISRNKLRAAEVWMDDYKALVKYATSPLPASLPLGDLGPRLELRKKLQCKDFNWYLKTVVPNMFVPHLSQNATGGALQTRAQKACMDTLGRSSGGTPLGVYPCHGQHGTQAFVMDGDGMVRIPMTGYTSCMAAEGSNPVIAQCDEGQKWVHWRLDPETEHFVSEKDNTCLEFSEKPATQSPFTLTIEQCEDNKKAQQWFWS